jgi:hypothetical protein
VRSFAAPPPLVTARFADPAPAAPPAPAGQPGAAATAPPPTAAAPARTPANFQDPIALVRALKLPVTPSNIAAAKLAIDTPQRLPAALATLESALPQSDDPRIATLRTITAFIGKIEPSSPQLATQIAAYVEHVVSGSEPQLAQLLNAYAQESATLPAPAAATDATATAAAPDEAAGAVPAGAAVAEAAATEPALPVVALAQIVERAAAIAVSLKEQIFSLVSGPAAGGAAGLGSGSDVLVPAAASALSAVTSVQLAAAQAALANPQTMTFAIPMWLGSGVYAQAKLAVDRDAPDTPSVPLDGDNFHIAFVLDTKHLGTVAIDLRTVGRAYSLSVKTETLRSAQRFGDELSRLTDRLSSLRYQSKSVEAVVAASATPAAPEPVPAVAVVTDAPSKAPADLFNESA